MASSDSLEKHYLDQLSVLGGVTLRKMFGAACLFHDGVAFAVIGDGALFLKTDDALRAELKELGGSPFTFVDKKMGKVEMSYSTPPESALDDVTELLQWARRSVAIAHAKKAAKATKKKKAPAPSAPAPAPAPAPKKKKASSSTKKKATPKTAATKNAAPRKAKKKT